MSDVPLLATGVLKASHMPWTMALYWCGECVAHVLCFNDVICCVPFPITALQEKGEGENYPVISMPCFPRTLLMT